MHALDRAKIFACIGEHEKYPWKPLPWPGIFNKVLFCEPVTGLTVELARVTKGATFPVHYHPTMQTLFLLSGKLTTAQRVITPGTFDVIPAGERHGGYFAEEESVQYKLFSSIPVYFLHDGTVWYYQHDGTVRSVVETMKSSAKNPEINIMLSS